MYTYVQRVRRDRIEDVLEEKRARVGEGDRDVCEPEVGEDVERVGDGAQLHRRGEVPHVLLVQQRCGALHPVSSQF